MAEGSGLICKVKLHILQSVFVSGQFTKNQKFCKGPRRLSLKDRLFSGHGLNDVRVTGVGDGEHAHPVVLSTGSAQLNIVCEVRMMESSMGPFQHVNSMTCLATHFQHSDGLQP